MKGVFLLDKMMDFGKSRRVSVAFRILKFRILLSNRAKGDDGDKGRLEGFKKDKDTILDSKSLFEGEMKSKFFKFWRSRFIHRKSKTAYFKGFATVLCSSIHREGYRTTKEAWISIKERQIEKKKIELLFKNLSLSSSLKTKECFKRLLKTGLRQRSLEHSILVIHKTIISRTKNFTFFKIFENSRKKQILKNLSSINAFNKLKALNYSKMSNYIKEAS